MKAIDAMVPKETQEATDSLPKAQSKTGITQLDGPGIVASTNVTETFTAANCQERLPESSEDRVCEPAMPPASNFEAASTELPLNVEEVSLIREGNNRTNHDADTILNQEFSEEFASRFPDPASTLDTQGSARSDQVTCCFLKRLVLLVCFRCL